jgi:hypothetical protein
MGLISQAKSSAQVVVFFVNSCEKTLWLPLSSIGFFCHLFDAITERRNNRRFIEEWMSF